MDDIENAIDGRIRSSKMKGMASENVWILLQSASVVVCDTTNSEIDYAIVRRTRSSFNIECRYLGN